MFFSSVKEINRLLKDINWLFSIRMSNIYLKVTIKEKWLTYNFHFLNLKSSSPTSLVSRSLFGELQFKQIWLNFQTSCCNLKIRGLGAKFCLVFPLLLFWTELWRFKVEESMLLLNKNINFNKSEMEVKMENPAYSFREMNLVFQLVWELWNKSKIVMNWSSQKKKECIVCNVCFVFFSICVLSQCIVYWINPQNIDTFTCQNTLLQTLVACF